MRTTLVAFIGFHVLETLFAIAKATFVLGSVYPLWSLFLYAGLIIVVLTLSLAYIDKDKS
jgi:hypothetical protein